ncbi:MAG TPA: DUF4352 domain-containing protein [Thermoanaerobacter sp.]|nr:MAG: hypothetical protein XD37_2177 [Thermoanaerobacter thermocopriae]HAA63831.1 DUF4352 domain-containing protein [Thermoanaerobacter sp.]
MFQKSKIVFLISTLLVLLFLLAGCGEPSSTTNTNSSNTQKEQVKEFYQVGETAAINGTEITVLKVEKSKGTEFDKPKSGMEFVIVTVKIKNTGKDKLSYNPLYFKMQNSKGQITDIAFSTINQDTALQSGDLAPGGEVEGTLIFEEPINDSGLILQYQNNIFSKEAKLQFKLNQ